MNRIFFALSVILIVAVAAWAYHINYRTKGALKDVSELRAEIAAKREALQVLRVEWAWLNRPERLKALVESHPELGLVPIGPNRFGAVAAVPYPPTEAADPLEAALAAAVRAGAFIRPVPGDLPLGAADGERALLAAGDAGVPDYVPIRLGRDGRMVGKAIMEVREGTTHFRLDAFESRRSAEEVVAAAPNGVPDLAGRDAEGRPLNTFVPLDRGAGPEAGALPEAPALSAGQGVEPEAPPGEASGRLAGLDAAGGLTHAPAPPPRRGRP